MSIQYTYSVIKVDEAARVMEVVYTADGRQTMHIGARLPYVGESLEAVVEMYAPVAYWLEQDAQVAAVAEGTTGTIGSAVVQTLESAKADKLSQIAQWRYEREVSGVAVDGATIATDRDSQAKLSSAYASLKDGILSSVNWKAQDGSFVVMTAQSIATVAGAVAQHVQSCFNAEMALIQQVNAAQTIEAVNAVVIA